MRSPDFPVLHRSDLLASFEHPTYLFYSAARDYGGYNIQIRQSAILDQLTAQVFVDTAETDQRLHQLGQRIGQRDIWNMAFVATFGGADSLCDYYSGNPQGATVYANKLRERLKDSALWEYLSDPFSQDWTLKGEPVSANLKKRALVRAVQTLARQMAVDRLVKFGERAFQEGGQASDSFMKTIRNPEASLELAVSLGEMRQKVLVLYETLIYERVEPLDGRTLKPEFGKVIRQIQKQDQI